LPLSDIHGGLGLLVQVVFNLVKEGADAREFPGVVRLLEVLDQTSQAEGLSQERWGSPAKTLA